ncbi:PDZ domain-containing protein [Sphingobium phenoxybenzoativorans]|uniref:PDZ domain-containing protein n=1 Tax=Sphingobium phenoxybenzoativorans TaxID=1592790 RepID=A0A975K3W0_9SPHN|nr:PDZ domain-containing protein [Sphingobium phenoxybenzoativorans]QUT04396.1 PDZ domain-containing protein [Sphingobium phenoxybenzoativorans]
MAEPPIHVSSDMRLPGARGRLRPRTAILWAGLLILSASPLMLLTQMPSDTPDADEPPDASGMTVADMSNAHEVVVTSVRTGGPAERGGLRAGDRLSGIGGRHPADGMMARHWLNESAACRIRINFLRGGAMNVATLDRCRDDGTRHGPQDTGRRG